MFPVVLVALLWWCDFAFGDGVVVWRCGGGGGGDGVRQVSAAIDGETTATATARRLRL